MAQPYTRGAVHIWVGTGSGGAAVYLGTGERAPDVSIHKRWRPVPNDLGGDVEFDKSYQGRWGVVSVSLTRWNDPVLRDLETVIGILPNFDGGGTDVAGDIGSLMITEGLAVPLWVMYSYAPGGNAPQPAFTTMRNGWHFFASWLEGPDQHRGGTDPAVDGLTFTCMRVFNASTGAFRLFDRDMSAALAVGIN